MIYDAPPSDLWCVIAVLQSSHAQLLVLIHGFFCCWEEAAPGRGGAPSARSCWIGERKRLLRGDLLLRRATEWQKGRAGFGGAGLQA